MQTLAAPPIYTARSPSIMYNKSAFWSLRPLTGKSGPSQMGVVFQTKKLGLGLLKLECTTS